jgi:hypothetical protein
MSQSPTAYGAMGPDKRKKKESRNAASQQKRGIATVDFASKRTKRIFHLSTSRHAVYCRAALESRDVAHCGRLR